VGSGHTERCRFPCRVAWSGDGWREVGCCLNARSQAIKVNTREHESDQKAEHTASVPAGLAIERIAAAMQAEPGLWTSHTYVGFSVAGGAEVSMHGSPFEDVSAMARLLGVQPVPYRLTWLDPDDDGRRLSVIFWTGADSYDGGTEIFWYTHWANAFEVLGPNLSALLDAAELTFH
jgi:hypothetical protein